MALKYLHDPGGFQLDMDAYGKQQAAYNQFASDNPSFVQAAKTRDVSGLPEWQRQAALSGGDWRFIQRYPTQDAYQADIQAQNQAMQNISPEQIAAAQANYNAMQNYSQRDNTGYQQLPTSGGALSQSLNPAQQAQASLNRSGMAPSASQAGKTSTFQNSPASQYNQTLGSNLQGGGGQTAQQYFDSIIGLNAQGQPNRAATPEEARNIYNLAQKEGITAEQIDQYFNYAPGTIAQYIQEQGWSPLGQNLQGQGQGQGPGFPVGQPDAQGFGPYADYPNRFMPPVTGGGVPTTQAFGDIMTYHPQLGDIRKQVIGDEMGIYTQPAYQRAYSPYTQALQNITTPDQVRGGIMMTDGAIRPDNLQQFGRVIDNYRNQIANTHGMLPNVYIPGVNSGNPLGTTQTYSTPQFPNEQMLGGSAYASPSAKAEAQLLVDKIMTGEGAQGEPSMADLAVESAEFGEFASRYGTALLAMGLNIATNNPMGILTNLFGMVVESERNQAQPPPLAQQMIDDLLGVLGVEGSVAGDISWGDIDALGISASDVGGAPGVGGDTSGGLAGGPGDANGDAGQGGVGGTGASSGGAGSGDGATGDGASDGGDGTGAGGIA